ncbi:hypothetical protein ES705_09059 [subsurface metagenome]
MDTSTNDSLRFTYCGMGKRIKKIEKPHGENPDTTSYVYDGMYAVCEFGGHLEVLKLNTSITEITEQMTVINVVQECV